MNRAGKLSVASIESNSVFKFTDRAMAGLFLLAFAVVWVKTCFAIPALQRFSWLEGVLLCVAVAAVVTSVSRTLPFQNVLWGAIVIGTIGGAAHAISVLSSIPFGAFVFTEAAGPRIFGILPWTIPLMWILFIYTSRGMARLILRPWRKTRVYGFWLMGITAMLSLILDLGMDPFASRINHFWIWEPTRFPYNWQGAPFTSFVGWLIAALMTMAFVTPMLINKKPGESPTEYRSTAIWILLNALFATSAIVHEFWLAAVIVSLATVAAIIFAVRGAKW